MDNGKEQPNDGRIMVNWKSINAVKCAVDTLEIFVSELTGEESPLEDCKASPLFFASLWNNIPDLLMPETARIDTLVKELRRLLFQGQKDNT